MRATHISMRNTTFPTHWKAKKIWNLTNIPPSFPRQLWTPTLKVKNSQPWLNLHKTRNGGKRIPQLYLTKCEGLGGSLAYFQSSKIESLCLHEIITQDVRLHQCYFWKSKIQKLCKGGRRPIKDSFCLLSSALNKLSQSPFREFVPCFRRLAWESLAFAFSQQFAVKRIKKLRKSKKISTVCFKKYFPQKKNSYESERLEISYQADFVSCLVACELY